MSEACDQRPCGSTQQNRFDGRRFSSLASLVSSPVLFVPFGFCLRVLLGTVCSSDVYGVPVRFLQPFHCSKLSQTKLSQAQIAPLRNGSLCLHVHCTGGACAGHSCATANTKPSHNEASVPASFRLVWFLSKAELNTAKPKQCINAMFL